MKLLCNKLGNILIIVCIIARMTLRFFAPEHIIAINILWALTGAAILLCVWSAKEIRKDAKEQGDAHDQQYAGRTFLLDILLLVLYLLTTGFMFLKK